MESNNTLETLNLKSLTPEVFISNATLIRHVYDVFYRKCVAKQLIYEAVGSDHMNPFSRWIVSSAGCVNWMPALFEEACRYPCAPTSRTFRLLCGPTTRLPIYVLIFSYDHSHRVDRRF